MKIPSILEYLKIWKTAVEQSDPGHAVNVRSFANMTRKRFEPDAELDKAFEKAVRSSEGYLFMKKRSATFDTTEYQVEALADIQALFDALANAARSQKAKNLAY